MKVAIIFGSKSDTEKKMRGAANRFKSLEQVGPAFQISHRVPTEQ